MTIFEAVREGNHVELARLLGEVEDVNALDEQGWTLLNWAAGTGDLEAVTLLVQTGADVFRRGRDNRTAYLIALAAGHRDIVRYLKDAEERRGGDRTMTSSRHGERRAYCRAYPIGLLRAFPAWNEPREADAPLPDEEAVFVHQDLSVTHSVLHGERVLFTASTSEWRSFCAERLAFAPPSDLDLLTAR
jgi:uncharacterized protein